MNNRNPLLRLGVGADGLKTGHTQEAGYGLVGSAKQGPRRVIFAVTGMTSAKERAEVSEQIVNWAFRQFSTKTILRAGKRVAEADVWMGDAPRVGLVATDDIDILVPVSAGDEVAAEVVYNGPLQAPIEAGQEIAELVIQAGDLPEVRVPLVAESSGPAGGFSVRMRTATAVLMKNFGLGS